MADRLFGVADRVIVLTGGLGRLGRAWGRGLLEAGARLAVFDVAARNGAPDEWATFGDERLALLDVDVTDRVSIETGLAAVRERWETPAGLVNGAARDTPPDADAVEGGPFEDTSLASWQRVMDVNVNGVFLTCQVVGGAMATAGRGSIVNVASIYGLVAPDHRIYAHRGDGFRKPAAYSASKSALLNLTRYLATYWAARGVRVNTLTLGGVADGQDERFVRAYSERVPLGRMARREEYLGPLVFLLSEASSYVTGSNLVADGGWTAW